MTTLRNKKEHGFTLVETLVAVALLVVGVTAAFSAAGAGLTTSSVSKDQVVAIYLAQEGIEKIRNVRDSNALAGNSWLSNLAANGSDPCRFGYSCRADAITGVLTRCPSGGCPVVRQDSATGFFGYNSAWTPTKFTRTITLTQVNANEVSMLVTVSWTRGLVTRTFRVRENILNWH